MKIEEVIDGAILELQKRGWTRGRREAEDGRVCARGALSYSIYNHPRVYLISSHDPFDSRVEGVIEELLQDVSTRKSLMVFNDMVAKSLEDVIRLFEKARASAAEQGI